MPISASKAARQAKRAAEGKEKKTPTSKLVAKAGGSKAGSNTTSQNVSENASKASSVNGDDPPMLDADERQEFIDERVKQLALQEDEHGLSDRVTTGVLASQEASRDVKITSASLVFHGRVLINDTTIEINFGRRYGLLGENGCGKSTLLKAIDKREFPFPEHIDIYLLNEGAPPSDFGALDWVVKQAENELQRLEKMSEDILEQDGPESVALLDLYDVSDSHNFSCRVNLIAYRELRKWTLKPFTLVHPLS
jgi:ATP-binding cassette, subfamily F, member 2